MRAQRKTALCLIGLVLVTLVPPSAFAEGQCDCCPCPCHCVCKEPEEPTLPPATLPPVTQPPPFTEVVTVTREECEVGCLDLGFIVDGTFSITPDNWEKVKQFLGDLISKFKIGPNLVQTAMVQFSKNQPPPGPGNSWPAQVEWDYSDPANMDLGDILTKLGDVAQLSWFTDYASAMELYLSDVLPTLRDNPEECDTYTHAVIFFTDGLIDIRQADLPGLAAQLRAATDDLVFGVGVGPDVNPIQLESFVDDPSKVITLPNFDDLASQLDPFVEEICETIIDKLPPIRVTPAPVPAPVPPTTPAPSPPGPRQCFCCCPPFFPPMTKW